MVHDHYHLPFPLFSRMHHSAPNPQVENGDIATDKTRIEDNCAPQRWTLIILVISLNVATFIAALDNTIVATAIPTITSEFHSIGDVGWYGSIYMLAMTPLQPILGSIYSMFNAKYVYISAIVIFEVGSIIGASASRSSVLIIGRAIAGVGAAAIFAGGMAIVTNLFSRDRRPRYISFLQSMFGMANMVGPLLGGLFTNVLSWRWCFWINAPFGFVIVLVVLFCYKEHGGNRQKLSETLTIHEKLCRMDILGSTLLVASVICMLLALHWGGTSYNWNSPIIICLVISAAVLVCGFGIAQYMHPQKAIIPFRLVSKRPVCASALYVFFLTIGRFTHIYYLPFYFQVCKGVSPIGSGLRFLPYSVAATLSTIVLGATISSIGLYALVQLIGAMLFTVGSVFIAFLQLNTSTARWIGYQILAGAGAGAGVQTPYIVAQVAVSSGDVHTVNAIIMFMTGLGGALSVSIAQNIFGTVVLKEIPKYTSGAHVDFEDILNLDGVQFLHSTEGVATDQKEVVLQVFTHALDKTFIIPIFAGSVCVLLALSALNCQVQNSWTQRWRNNTESRRCQDRIRMVDVP
ncbi:major facilitator superfamily-domain-containing protein [Lentinula edodes]|uniref:Major facilitator superfamily-domain-containing protein n=1 Tax=Lentinula lateritia TaxID=40482 RepID=A0A9W9DDJ0_9AGAR|nr:major facilitator superfamily-domain-containing protein [Lentinula edodes]